MFSSRETKDDEKGVKAILFTSAVELHNEYKRFSKSAAIKKLVVVGDEERAWNVFRSLFGYIEAAGGVVKNSKGELLMIYRNKHWDLPKGKMEKDENSAQTALREVEEECGVKQLKIIREVASTYHIFFQDKNEWIKRTYWYEMACNDTSKPNPQAEEGIQKAEWMKIEEVKKVMNKIYPSLQEILRSTFSL